MEISGLEYMSVCWFDNLKTAVLDANSTRNENESINFSSVDMRRWPGEAAAHTNDELRAQNLFLGPP